MHAVLWNCFLWFILNASNLYYMKREFFCSKLGIKRQTKRLRFLRVGFAKLLNYIGSIKLGRKNAICFNLVREWNEKEHMRVFPAAVMPIFYFPFSLLHLSVLWSVHVHNRNNFCCRYKVKLWYCLVSRKKQNGN